MDSLETPEGIMYCVKSVEGTFYTRDKAYLTQYLQHFLQDPIVFELRGGQVYSYLGTGKTYLNVLAESDII